MFPAFFHVLWWMIGPIFAFSIVFLCVVVCSAGRCLILCCPAFPYIVTGNFVSSFSCFACWFLPIFFSLMLFVYFSSLTCFGLGKPYNTRFYHVFWLFQNIEPLGVIVLRWTRVFAKKGSCNWNEWFDPVTHLDVFLQLLASWTSGLVCACITGPLRHGGKLRGPLSHQVGLCRWKPLCFFFLGLYTPFL